MAAGGKANRELNSWKEIANYLGVCERTAQKYEKKDGLPARRLPGPRGRVTADTSALDEWKDRVLRKPSWYASPVALRYYSVATTAVLLVVGILWGIRFFTGRVGPPEKYRLDGKALVVLDARGKEVWRHAFEERILAGQYQEQGSAGLSGRRVLFQKLGPSGETRCLFAYIAPSSDTTGTPLFCFSQSGVVMWKFYPGREVSDRKQAHPGGFEIRDIHAAPLEATGRPHVLVTSHHHSGQPNQFAILDENGKLLREYWHCGYLPLMEVADLDRDGVADVVLAGVNNGYGSAILLVLDPRNCSGALSQEPGDPLALQGFSPGNEKAALLLPRTCINSRKELYNPAIRLSVGNGYIEVDTQETFRAEGISATYRFDFNLGLQSVFVWDGFKTLHRELRERGELDHDFSDAEEKALGQKVRWLKRWDPASKRLGPENQTRLPTSQ